MTGLAGLRLEIGGGLSVLFGKLVSANKVYLKKQCIWEEDFSSNNSNSIEYNSLL
jgi:hypothetical protein